MKLAKAILPDGRPSIVHIEDSQATPLDLSGEQYRSLFDILESADPGATVRLLLCPPETRVAVDQLALLPPIDQQEVWAAGVTYRRSKTARMEESEGAARFYDLVYEAPRPELFFKATPHRVVGPGGRVRIRTDAKWNVPEPELALVLNSRLELVGCTIGNDMSSRDIEGENPLYLPQAKVYDQCCALGPCVTLLSGLPPREEIRIHLDIIRGDEVVFEGDTNIGQMARSFESLIGYLGRDNSFPQGAFLLTGTGIVPSEAFTLYAGDLVSITIDGIGTLSNRVVQG